MHKKIVVIDGQGGKLGRMLVEQIKCRLIECDIYAIGTNSAATATMMKAGADFGATGENPVIVACRDADVVVGPIGIVIADSLTGEITPGIAAAIGQCSAKKVLLPVNRCGNIVVGVKELPVSELINIAVDNVVNAVKDVL